MRTVIAIGGSPGTGKTTLMRAFMRDKVWETVEPKKTLSTLYCRDLDLYILGKYAEGEVFAGTDRLSMAVQPVLEAWMTTHQSHVLFEGDRVFNQSFLEFLLTLSDTEVHIDFLRVPQSILLQRYRDRGSNQSEQFLKGRATKYQNLMGNFALRPHITEYAHVTPADQALVLHHLHTTLL